ncbi:MAG: amidase [Frankiaceae bacterium]|nr:amidase [Frankiaceae bacterium]
MRRQLLAACLALTVAPALPHAAASSGDCLSVVHGVNIVTSTVPQLDAALAKHRITSRQLTLGYLARIKAFDHGGVKVNAIRAFTKDALAQADASDRRRKQHKLLGPLDGIPVILKDNIGTRDAPTTAGSIAFAGNIPKHEATIVAKLRKAGAVILAKTNLSEFANWVDLSMPNGYSSLGGQVVAPYTEGDPSGSSSGSGVAATMAFAAVTIGTETSGSILSPSDVNSDVGVKPTLGLASTTGIIPLAPSFDVPGPIVRNVTDAAAVLGVIATKRANYLGALKPGALKGVRLGIPSADNRPSGARGALFDRAIADLKKAGATIVETDVVSNGGIASLSELGLIPNEFKWSLNEYLANEARPKTGVKTLADIVAYNDLHKDKVKYGQNLLIASNASPGVGAIAAPAALPVRTQAQAVIDGALAKDDLDAILDLGATNANVGAAAGYPTVIVPAGYVTDTVPTGLAFTGTAFSEAKLLGYAYAYEQASRRRVPPTVINPDLYPKSC